METKRNDFVINEAEDGELMGAGGSEAPGQAKKVFSRIGCCYFGGAVLIFAVQYLIAWIVHIIFPQVETSYDAALIISSMSMYLLSMPCLAAVVRRIPGTTLPRHKMGVGKWFAAFFMSYAILYISNIIGVVTTWLIGVAKGSVVDNPLADITAEISPLTAFVLMVVCAPIAEEILFRKLLVDRTVKYGEKTAVILSGLMFGLFHGNLNQFVYAVLLGMFFGFIYVKTGKLIYTITLHAVINFMGSIPGILMMRSGVFKELESISGSQDEIMSLVMDYKSEIMIYLIYLIGIFVIVIVGVICWALSFKKMKCAPGQVVIPKGQRFRTVFLNVGMILYTLFWLVEIVKQLLE